MTKNHFPKPNLSPNVQHKFLLNENNYLKSLNNLLCSRLSFHQNLKFFGSACGKGLKADLSAFSKSDDDEENAAVKKCSYGSYIEPHFRKGTRVKGHWRRYGEEQKLVWVGSHDRQGGWVKGHCRGSSSKKN